MRGRAALGRAVSRRISRLLAPAVLSVVLAGGAPALAVGPASGGGQGRAPGPGALGAQEVPSGAFTRPRVPVSLERTGEGGVALRIQVPEGWALYTPSPGPLGLPLEVSWAADGVPVSLEPAWPSDEPYPSATGTARVFRGPVVLRVAAEALPPGVGTLAASARWAVCRDDLCVPGRSDAELTLRR